MVEIRHMRFQIECKDCGHNLEALDESHIYVVISRHQRYAHDDAAAHIHQYIIFENTDINGIVKRGYFPKIKK
jgi:hypothetical protein